ncbi:hypothetical protein BN1723_002945 [Verticillium longisporum]|uniref:Cytochrome P450 n=1 Tax=Verticillium longisporum TaxID=100787 RepID=A0A0G4LMA3_VERLO|nr:hypothetical protein BN1723_002945 [Verticillium longisporum]
MAQSFPSGGMIEYIVSQEYARKVLTEESSFSFECGMEEVRCPHIFFPKRWLLTLVKILGIQWMRYIHGGTFFRDVDSVVRELSTKKLRSIAKETWPVFELGVSELLNTVQDEKPVDILPHVKRIMAQATIRILLGPTYQNEEDVNRILDISADVAELMGLRRHESRMAHKYPRLWRTLTLTKIVLIRLPLDIGLVFARRLWADISSREKHRDPEDETIFSHLVDRYASTSGSVSFLSKLWIMILILTVIFGSVHQTAVIIVWVTYFLAIHPDCQKSIRDEAESLVRSEMSGSGSEYKALQDATLVDSFVREVLRMKGDTVNAVRVAVRDVELAGHRIPKGSCLSWYPWPQVPRQTNVR